MANHTSHAGHLPAGSTRSLVITGWLTGVYFLFELAIGLWTGSVAVMSDAFHTFSAVGGVLIALVAGHIAGKAAGPRQTFGWFRAEIVGALFNGLFLTVMAIVVLWMGAMRLMNPIHLPTGPMLLAAAGGLITECIALGLLWKEQKGNLNVRGAFWHILQTFVGSLIIVVSALVIRFTDFLAIDPLLGMVFGLVLFWASWGIIRDALHILLERAPSDLDVHAAMKAIRAIPGVKDVHHVHAWTLTSGKNVFTAHACIEDRKDPQHILDAIRLLLKDRFNVYFSTIQLEETCRDPEEPSAIDITRDMRSHAH